MKQESIDKFFKRNTKESITMFADGSNEYGDPYYLLVSVIDEDWEYGYGDYTFKYDSVDDFIDRGRSDVDSWGDIEDIERLSIDVVFYNEEDPDDDEIRIEMDEV